MAPIGAKLGQNAFQTIPNVFFFDTEKKVLDDFVSKEFWYSTFFSKKLAFRMSQGFLSVIGRSVVKSYFPKWGYFWGDFLGGGVNVSICVENLDLAPKMTSTIWCWDAKFLASIFF